MRRIKRSATSLLICIALTGCYTSQQLIDPPVSLKKSGSNAPEFLNNLEIAGNRSSGSILYKEHKTTPSSIPYSPETRPDQLQSKYAAILGVVPQIISNVSLYHFIEQWYGVPYRLGGADQQGIDCSAFVQKLYDQVFCTSILRSAVEQFRMCSMVYRTDSLKEGDLVFFRTAGKRISHVGIYLMNDFFVHASSTQGVTVSNLNETYWKKRYAGAGKPLVLSAKL
ncbi:MAG: hypothetical protein EOP49_04930 [Sphingobacteriales bacterium]|nr:MAG: hypothetical protein EOP49_04930 [Sphingobacteriales bacterium]